MEPSTAEGVPRTDDLSRRLVLNMSRTPGARFEVTSCEVSSRAYRNRTVFNGHPTLHQALVPKAAEQLEAFLSTLTGETEVMSFPDYVLELPSATLAGLQVVVKQQETGEVNVILRFRLFLGSINALFRCTSGVRDEGVDELADHLAIKALLDLALPILNLGKLAQFAQPDEAVSVGGFNSILVKRAYEIEFQVELLKRYVENQERQGQLAKQAAGPRRRLS